MSKHQIRILRQDGSVSEQAIDVAEGQKVTDAIVEFGTKIRNSDPSVCAIRLVGSLYRWMGHHTDDHMQAVIAASDANGNF